MTHHCYMYIHILVKIQVKSLSHQMTALSVGYIQTYRDSVDSLGESVDMSIKVRFGLSEMFFCLFNKCI